ncbi:MAG: xanthine dehydrogenase accessory protein XdhC [Pseudomonadota bacterium]
MSSAHFQDLAELASEGRTFVVATVVSTGGSTPQKPGARMAVLEDGSLRGTVGGGAIEQQVVEAARALMRSPDSHRLLETHLTHELGMCCGGKMQLFLEKHVPSARLWVFGAGHVAKELASLARHVGFRVSVVDERAEWATAERFPGMELVRRDPATVASELPGGADCFFCVTTHDHPLDQAVVEALLGKPAAYLGVIGSRRRLPSASWPSWSPCGAQSRGGRDAACVVHLAAARGQLRARPRCSSRRWHGSIARRRGRRRGRRA